MHSVPLTVITNNSPGLRRLRDPFPRLSPTINLSFRMLGESGELGYEVHLFGHAIPEDGGGQYVGKLKLPRQHLRMYIQRLRELWRDRLVSFCPDRYGDRDHPDYLPFSALDFRASPHLSDLDPIMRELAREGYKLYDLIFSQGDRILREIGRLLSAALRKEEQVVSIQSDDLFAPWWMLYLPVDGDDDPEDESFKWQYSGFLGHRHLLEHNFRRDPDFKSELPVGSTIKVGMYVDRNLDLAYPLSPPVSLVKNVFDENDRCSVELRFSGTELRRDIVSKAPNSVLYFCCHAVVTGDGDHADAYFELTDRDRVTSSDLARWLAKEALPAQPVVFMNACEGGQMSSLFYPSFSRILTDNGANCLVGPQMDIPVAFARWYAKEFFERLLTGGRTVGFVFHDLAVDMVERYGNPLGLAFSLFRGMNTHFLFTVSPPRQRAGS
jgi:hypothetical protein